MFSFSLRSFLFSLPETWARLLAWLALGFLFYLVPMVLVTLKDIRMSGGDLLSWLPEGTEEKRVFDAFAERFHSYDSLLVSWEGALPDDPLFDEIVREIFTRDRTRSFQTGEAPLIGSAITSGGFLESLGEPYASSPEFRKRAFSELSGFLTSRDGETGLLIVESTEEGAKQRALTFSLVDQVVSELVPEGTVPRYEGPCFMYRCTNIEVGKLLKQFFPLSALASLLVASFFLRSISLGLIAFGISGMAAAMSMVCIHFSLGEVSDMLSVVPSLTQLLATSNIVHLINYYRESVTQQGDRKRAWREALCHGWLPTIAASVSTMIGVGALMTSDLPVIRSFAVFGMIGVFLSMVFSLGLTAVALILLLPVVRREASVQRLTVNGLCDLSLRWHWPVSVLLLGLFAFGGMGLPRLRSDVSLQSFFSEESVYPVNQSWFETRLGPVTGSDLLVIFPETVELEDRFELIDRLGTEIEGLDPSYVVFSPSIYDRLIEEGSTGEKWEKVKKSGMVVEEGDRQYWRILVRHPFGPEENEVFRRGIDHITESVLHGAPVGKGGKIEIYLTGYLQLYALSQAGLIDQLLRTFFCAFLIITPLIILVLGRLWLGLVAMIGNLFPLVVFFGILGWLDFRMDVATMMIAAVAFGIAVDDTIHFITWFSRGLSREQSLGSAIRFAFSHCAGAMLQTTLIISLGLSVYFLGDFQPSVRFATFSGLVLVIALVGDLVLMPSMILGPFRRLFSRYQQANRSRNA